MIDQFDQTHEESGIQFVARAIRRDKGQLRADVSIRYKGRELDRDEFRFSDRAKRNALAGSAFLSLGGATTLPGKKEEMQLLLRQFNDCVEEQWQQSIVVEDVAGLAEPVTPPWIVKDYVTAGAITALAAAPGKGKSWTGMLIAQSVQHAIPKLFEVYEPMPVLYVNLERSALSLRNRLGLVNRVLEIDAESTMPQLNARGRSMGEVQEAVRRHMEANGTQFVVIDSLSRMGMGSMTQDDSTNEMMDLINSFGAGTLLLAHTPRPAPSVSEKGRKAAIRASEHVFGSQMITGAIDFEVILKAKDSEGQSLVGMKVIKANDAPRARLRGWLYRYGPAGLINVTPANHVTPEHFEEE